MSSLFNMGQRKPTSDEKITMVENEMLAMADLHNRLSKICTQKCVPTDYREGDLNKGEAVCLDRCSAKFFEAWMKTNELMQSYSQNMGGAAGRM